MEILIGSENVLVEMDRKQADLPASIRYKIVDTTDDEKKVINVVQEDLTTNATEELKKHPDLEVQFEDPFPVETSLRPNASLGEIKVNCRSRLMNMSHRERSNYVNELSTILRDELHYNLEFTDSGGCQIVGLAGHMLEKPITLQDE